MTIVEIITALREDLSNTLPNTVGTFSKTIPLPKLVLTVALFLVHFSVL